MNSKQYFGKIVLAMVVFAAVCVLSVPNVMAAPSGTTSIEINTEEVIVLFYHDKITYDLAGSELINLLTGVANGGAFNKGNNTGTITSAAGSLTGTLAAPLNSDMAVTLSNVTLVLKDCWKVKGNAKSKTVNIDVALNGAAGANTLTGPNGSTIVINANPTAVPASVTGVKLDSEDKKGDVSMTLNLTGLSDAGLHNNTSAFQFTITATSV